MNASRSSSLNSRPPTALLFYRRSVLGCHCRATFVVDGGGGDGVDVADGKLF